MGSADWGVVFEQGSFLVYNSQLACLLAAHLTVLLLAVLVLRTLRSDRADASRRGSCSVHQAGVYTKCNPV